MLTTKAANEVTTPVTDVIDVPVTAADQDNANDKVSALTSDEHAHDAVEC